MSSSKKYVLVVGGPTASGKTSLSIALAQHFNSPILSADSRQFYKEMKIGTASPTEEELKAAEHHFIGHLSIQENYSVGDFERDGLALLKELFKKHSIVILTGGTGLYIKALCEGLNEFPPINPEVKQELEVELNQNGIATLLSELKSADPKYYEDVDIHNPHRLLRALAVIRSTGKSFSHFRNQPKLPRDFTPIYLAIEMDRPKLYDRINQRVDDMMKAGLLKEVQSLYPYRALNSLNTVGYKELFAYIDKQVSLDEAKDKIKQHTRNYAKRQMTWFRNQGQWTHISLANIKEIISLVESRMLR